MDYFDPNRPRLASGHPMLLSQDGSRLCAIPWLMIRPTPTLDEDGADQWEAQVMLPVGPNSYKWFYATVPDEALLEALKVLKQNPEGFFQVVFSWTYNPTIQPHVGPARPRIDIKDLEL